MKIGLLTFGSLIPNTDTSVVPSPHQRIGDVIEQGVEAEKMGFDWFAVGEHHFAGFAISSPPVVLASLASLTSTIRLGTGVTLAANRDPVLMAEDYATLDLLSGGRVSVVCGKGFYPEPFKVFDQPIETQRERLAENVSLLLRLWNEESVHWAGKFRTSLDGITVQPRPLQERAPVWMSGGSSEDSSALAASLGLPIVMNTAFLPPSEYAPVFARYREIWRSIHADTNPAPTGAVSHVFVARTSQEAKGRWREHYRNFFNWGNQQRKSALGIFDFDASISGPAICGSPEEVIEKIGAMQDEWHHDLHLLSVDIGGMAVAEVLSVMELLAQEVLPATETMSG